MKLAALLLVSQVATSTPSEWRENLWRETAILNETLLLRAERQKETVEKQLFTRNRQLEKCEAQRTTLPAAPREESLSPFVVVGIVAGALAIFGGGVWLGTAVR